MKKRNNMYIFLLIIIKFLKKRILRAENNKVFFQIISIFLFYRKIALKNFLIMK